MTMADPAAEATIPPAMTMADPAAARTVDDRLARPRVHRIDMRPLVERLEGPASNSVQVPPLWQGMRFAQNATRAPSTGLRTPACRR
jgi:hypothetical protein